MHLHAKSSLLPTIPALLLPATYKTCHFHLLMHPFADASFAWLQLRHQPTMASGQWPCLPEKPGSIPVFADHVWLQVPSHLPPFCLICMYINIYTPAMYAQYGCRM